MIKQVPLHHPIEPVLQNKYQSQAPADRNRPQAGTSPNEADGDEASLPEIEKVVGGALDDKEPNEDDDKEEIIENKAEERNDSSPGTENLGDKHHEVGSEGKHEGEPKPLAAAPASRQVSLKVPIWNEPCLLAQ